MTPAPGQESPVPEGFLFYFGFSSAALLLPTDNTSFHDLCDSSVRSLDFGFKRKPGRGEVGWRPGGSEAGKRLSR